jgi:hypothetical protein
MKTSKIQRIISKGCLAAITVGLVALPVTSANAADLLVGLSFPSQGSGGDDVVTFSSANPGTILSDFGISGLAPNENLRGIDAFNGVVYGVGSLGNLYTLNYNNGAATLVGHFGTLNGAAEGVENDGTGVRVVTELGQNWLVNRTTGVGTAGPNLTPGLFLTALAFNGSTMFAIDSSANTLGTFNPALGTYSTIGSMGFDVARNNGFDISAGGIAYLVSGASSSDVQANLYRVNLATGLASLVGLVGQPGDNTLLRGLTVVPEPGTATLIIGGLGLLALQFRRRR